MIKFMIFTTLLANGGPAALRPAKIDTKLARNGQNSPKSNLSIVLKNYHINKLKN